MLEKLKIAISADELKKILVGQTGDSLFSLLRNSSVNPKNKPTINEILQNLKNTQSQKSYTMGELRNYDDITYFQYFKTDIIMCLEKISEPYKGRFIKNIVEIIEGKADELGKFSQLTGVMGEMESTIRRCEQGYKLGDMKEISVTYLSPSSQQERTDKIQNDVPLNIEGKARIYETKNYPRFLYGAKESEYNQYEKYQAAVQQGKVSGVTFEIQGRISGKLHEYIQKFSEIEVIYTLPLPSGAKYQTVLHISNNKNIGAYNGNIKFSDQDQKIINAIEHNKNIFINILYDIPQGYTFDDIKNMKQSSTMIEFQNKRREHVWEKILATD